ncbi:MAG TPA: methyltransferase domain-containing protein [Bryobacteraceae bacterium]|nr:methyltransferase domain-containing protein [Bryobacteraceae bacterium]
MAGKGDVLKYHATPQRDSGAESGVKTFLRESVRSWPTTAALLPSSRALADSLIRYIDFGSARTIVELGVGTGAITSEILCRIKPDARIYALDISSIFIEHVRQKFNDPRLVPILADARELTDVLGVWKLGRVDAVVSSLGLTCMDNDARLAVFDQVTRCLSNQGVFTQYQYIHARAIPGWCGRIGISGFNVAKFLRRYFQNVSAETVLWNAPPALVYTCQW